MSERLVLSNQYRILEKLYPEEAAYFAEARETVEQGYEGYYWRVFQSIDSEVVTQEECKEVLETMTMYSCLKDSFERLTDKSGIDARDIQFDGFDGNNESSLLSFANFYCGSGGRKFTDLIDDHVPNSHSPRIDMYRRMLSVWASVPERMHRPREMSKESIQKIIAARTYAR
jgi:uncharacterized protein YfbU (UPF0304 family)